MVFKNDFVWKFLILFLFVLQHTYHDAATRAAQMWQKATKKDAKEDWPQPQPQGPQPQGRAPEVSGRGDQGPRDAPRRAGTERIHRPKTL